MAALLRFGLVLALLFAAMAGGRVAVDPLVDPARAQTGAGARTALPREIGPREIGPSGLALPRFVTLRAAKVNLRTGPGIRYPIEWVYARKGLPLEVIDEFETWRRVRDWQGSVGWIHQSMLSGQRGAMVVGEGRLLRRAPEDGAPGVARVAAGVVGRLRACAGGWCLIEAKGLEGWLRQDQIYGAYPDETVE
jgi:SH3-like domain-containing protein